MTDYHLTAGLPSVTVLHRGTPVTITRAQDPAATIRAEYAPIARACPPYCIQPIMLAAGVETFGELEVLDYLSRIAAGDTQYLVIDSRTADWYEKVTIPGAINVPYGQNMAGQPTDLPALGYPAEKLKWYRGGMQDWCALGLTTT